MIDAIGGATTHLLNKTAKHPEEFSLTRFSSQPHLIRPLGEFFWSTLTNSGQVGEYDVKLSPRVTLARRRSLSQLMVEGQEFPGSITLIFTTPDSGTALIDSLSNKDANFFTLIAGGNEIRAYLSPGCEYYGLAIETGLLHELDPELLNCQFFDRTENYPISRDQVLAITARLRYQLINKTRQQDFEFECGKIAIDVLSGLQGKVPVSSASNRARCVKIAMQYITDHHSENPRLDQIAKQCHCSLRTLDYAFTSYLGMTPKQYLLAYRLNMYRHSILEAPETPVGEHAYSLGYVHLGNLARTYRSLFSELPSETVEKIRSRSLRNMAKAT